MLGIFRNFADREQVYHHKGLPILQAKEEERHNRRKPIDKSTAERFALSFCWKHDKGGQRLRDFPSWSWTGWTKGEISYPVRPIQGNLEPRFRFWVANPKLEFHAVKSENNELMDLDTLVQMFENKAIVPDLSNVLLVDTWVIKMRFAYLPHGLHSRDGECIGPQGLYWKTGVLVDPLAGYKDLVPFTEDNCAIYQRINLTGANQHFNTILESEELDGLVLSETPELILVLVGERDINERIGIVDSEQFLGPRKIENGGTSVEAFPNPERYNLSEDTGQRTWRRTHLG
jgi:hypothetical protein